MIHNYKLTIAYDGTRYLGWEHQPGTDKTIQGKLEGVLWRMLEEEDAARAASSSTGATVKKEASSSLRPEIIGCGRTDAGVHARGMVANSRFETNRSEEEIRDYCNRYLPDDILVKEVKVASDRFHARYRAVGKTYRYTCYVGELKPLFDRRYVWHLREKPDVNRMRKAASYLTGEHDFASFCGNPRMKKSTVRTVDRIDIVQKGSYLTLTFHGNGFLQYMVRILTGTLLEIGWGWRSPEEIPSLLEAKNRSLAGQTAPACGLCMMGVDY